MVGYYSFLPPFLGILPVPYMNVPVWVNTTSENAVTSRDVSCTTRIFGTPKRLRERGSGRLLVVTGPFFYDNGTAEKLAGQAGAQAVEYFHQVAPDPSVALAAQATAAVQAFHPDTILALGGGSAMDLAKATVYFSGHDAKLVAVPTTSGSGSEVTSFAILTHDGVKHPLVDDRLRPAVAIVDPELVKALPRPLIADGGFDVLTHAMEAYVANGAGPITDALALDAFATTFQELGRSYQGAQTARARVHQAATMAGLAFTQAGLGACHALAHSLGGEFHVPHGRLNAILLPAVLTANAPAAAHKYAKLARAAGLEGRADTMAVRALKSALVRLRRELELPATLAEAGVDMTVLRSRMDGIVNAALADPCCEGDPVPVTQGLLYGILREVSGG